MIETITFEEALEKNGRLIYTNKGVSMMPFLRQRRDIINIVKADGEIKKYDAVVFKRLNGQYVLHRVIKIKNGVYHIAGDNCIEVEKVKREQIIGVLESVERNGRTVLPNSPLYVVYVHLWCDFFHIRCAIIFCVRVFKEYYGRLKAKIKSRKR